MPNPKGNNSFMLAETYYFLHKIYYNAFFTFTPMCDKLWTDAYSKNK